MLPFDRLNFTIKPLSYVKKIGILESSPELYFRITYSICHRHFTVSEDISHEWICTFQEDAEPRTIHFSTNIGLFRGDRGALDKLSESLSGLGLDSELEHRFLSEVIQAAKRITVRCGRSGDGGEIRRFDLNGHVEKYYYYDEVDVLETEMQSVAEYEDRNYGMVAADPSSSIGMMKSVILEDKCEEEEGEICSVCLEEVVGVASAMPCAHLFHENCIIKWLQMSHVCPLCRFPMPVD